MTGAGGEYEQMNQPQPGKSPVHRIEFTVLSDSSQDSPSTIGKNWTGRGSQRLVGG